MDWTPIITAGVTGLCAVLGQLVISHQKNKQDEARDAEREKNQNQRLSSLEARMDAQCIQMGDIQEAIKSNQTQIEQIQQTVESNQAQITQIYGKLDAQKSHLDTLELNMEKVCDKLTSQESALMIQQDNMSHITKELDDNNLRTLRLDLLHAIESDPSNQMVILDLAQKYFVEMKGNCYMSKVFQEWADEHHVNITSIFNKG